jgi:hypothetical protein
MQSGFDAATSRVIGTPVEPHLQEAIKARPGPLPPTDHATALLDTLWMTELSMSERNALFVKAAPVLEGMTLTKPPTGGFSTAARSVVVGAGPGGPEFNTRLNASTVFLQPGYPGKYLEVGPPDAASVNPEAPPFRAADGKTHLPGNPMTLARFDAEGEAAAVRAAAFRDAADPPVPPVHAPAVQGPAAPPGPTVGGLRHLASSIREATGLQLAPAVGVAGSSSAGSSAPVGPPSGPPDGTPSFVQQLRGWWMDARATPMGLFAASTWTTDNQWEPIVILAACLVVVVIIIAVACTAAGKRRVGP